MSDQLLISTRKGLFHLSRASENKWNIDRVSFPAENITLAVADPRDGAIYAGLELGHFGTKLRKSVDNGETWEELDPPKYPEGEMLEPSDFDLTKESKPANLELIWSITPGADSQPGLLWIGTIPGGLFKSTDYGNSWHLVRSLWDHPKRKKWFGGGRDRPGIHSIHIHPDNPEHITLAVSCGGVWISENAGETWEIKADGMRADYMPPERSHEPDIQDVHMLARCKNHPDRLWAQHHNGIFISSDNAESWSEISQNANPSAFGFGVVVHPNDPDTAWFVPAHNDEERIPLDGKVVVMRTTDGGESFHQLTKGLPQDHAYDLVFRHALDIDGSGDHLAFGSTTGSLWVSEDGGESWGTVSNHLPPIYAVRYA